MSLLRGWRAPHVLQNEEIRANFEDLENFLTISEKPWIAPVLGEGWKNSGGANSTAGFLKDPLGWVHCKGRIESGATGTIPFILPIDYRPGATELFSVAGFEGATPKSVGAAVNKAGEIQIFFTAGVTNVGLSGINFLAEN